MRCLETVLRMLENLSVLQVEALRYN